MYSRHRVAGIISIDQCHKIFVFSAGSGCNPGYHDQLFCLFPCVPKVFSPCKIQHPFMLRKSTPYIFPSIAI